MPSSPWTTTPTANNLLESFWETALTLFTSNDFHFDRLEWDSLAALASFDAIQPGEGQGDLDPLCDMTETDTALPWSYGSALL